MLSEKSVPSDFPSTRNAFPPRGEEVSWSSIEAGWPGFGVLSQQLPEPVFREVSGPPGKVRDENVVPHAHELRDLVVGDASTSRFDHEFLLELLIQGDDSGSFCTHLFTSGWAPLNFLDIWTFGF